MTEVSDTQICSATKKKTESLKCSLFSISSSNCLKNQKLCVKEYRLSYTCNPKRSENTLLSENIDFAVTDTQVNNLEAKDYKQNSIGIMFQQAKQQQQKNQYKMLRLFQPYHHNCQLCIKKIHLLKWGGNRSVCGGRTVWFSNSNYELGVESFS